MKTVLLGSAPDFIIIQKVISAFFYGSPFTLRENKKDWTVINYKGDETKLRIIKKGKRYRFEMEMP